METLALYFLFGLSGFGHSFLGKKSSNLVPNKSISKYVFIVGINAIIACIFFWVLNAFRLNLNTGLLVYAVIHAVIIIIARIITLVAYKYLSVADVMIFLNAGKMIISSVTGVFLFDEKMTLIKIIKMLLMTAATVFICIEEKAKEKGIDKKGKAHGINIGLIILVIVMILAYSAQVILNKYYSLSPYQTDEQSFCFATNAAMFIICAVLVLFALIGRSGEIKDATAVLRPRALAIVSGDTVSNAASTILMLMLIARVDISLFSPVSNSLGIITSVLASLFLREKLGIYSYIAVAIATVAVII